MNDKPPLIAISGIDGAGKSTQARRVVEALTPAYPGIRGVKTEFYGMYGVFELARTLTGDARGYHPLIPATLREFVIACDALTFSERVLRPAAEQGVALVWDRSPLCYEVYGHCYGADMTWPMKALAQVRRPDLIVLVDLDAELAVKRLAERAEQPHQSDEDLDLLSRVRARYLERASRRDDVEIVDGDRSTEEVTTAILDVVAARLGE
ncbi:dTMP kinase [Actinophytocola xinjiangensis]|uniref:dTMP kinase n=1 Tax=Actinophytocola xinjiangensis TaxID=485602 RepID=UPI000A42BB65|nr:dTMP kinase [Actinophytocola xinjiangensis]